MAILKQYLTDAADFLGFEVENEKEKIFKGYFEGYTTVVKHYTSSSNLGVVLSVKKGTQDSSQEIITFLNNLKNEYKNYIKVATYNQHKISIIAYQPYLTNKSLAKLKDVLTELTNYLKLNNYTNCCGFCDEEINISSYLVNEECYLLCNNCFNKLINELDVQKHNIKNKKSNLLTGMVGAFLGSLIGVIVWVIIYQLGYIAALGGIAIVICAIKGYTIFDKNITKASIFLIILLSIIMIFFAETVSMAIEFHKVYASASEYQITYIDAFKSIPRLIDKSTEIATAFWTDIAIGVFLTIVGSARYVIRAFKNVTGSYSAKKISNDNNF